MNKLLSNSPIAVRVVPLVTLVVLTFLQGKVEGDLRYWIYVVKTLLGAIMLCAVWPHVREMRWKFSWEAVVVGIGVFAVWVGLDEIYPRLGGAGELWNPHQQFGQGTALAWMFISIRVVGSTFIVPPLEEIFYRSFLYRFIARQDFEKVSLGEFRPVSFLVSAVVFGLAHHEWLAGILCGLMYQGLVVAKRRLGDAITAHAITNFLLALWIISKGDWKFW